jgi:protein arginine N-methyltransferase 1
MPRYSLAAYGLMLADAARVEAYAQAIGRFVGPGKALAEIGTGTGFFAILAARAGARKVYAIEADDVIEAARANAVANGCAESIEFIRGLSSELSLPERVDVVLSDLRGVLPFHETHLQSIRDARERFLAPGGVLIPHADTIRLACVEAADVYAKRAGPWCAEKYRVELPAARALAVNDWSGESFQAGQLLTDPVPCLRIDYAACESDGFSAQVEVCAQRDGTAHGLALWFDVELAAGIGFSSGPGAGRHSPIYGQAFFPWERPVPLAQGERLRVEIAARPSQGDYLWTWNATGQSVRFRQSSFLGAALSSEGLRRIAADHVPRPGDEARIDAAILAMMDEGHSLGAIASQLVARFPQRFARWESALAHAGELSERYGKPV